MPRGEFSHRDTLKEFQAVLANRVLKIDKKMVTTVEELMAFRHVATKIYGFLLDWNKLESIVSKILRSHKKINSLFLRVVESLKKQS